MKNGDEEFRDDPQARRLAERLSRTDFAADGFARERVRARLAARSAAPDRAARIARPLAAASFAAALAVFILPFALKEPAPKTEFPRGPQGLPVLAGRLPAWGSGPAETVFETRSVTIEDIFERRKP